MQWCGNEYLEEVRKLTERNTKTNFNSIIRFPPSPHSLSLSHAHPLSLLLGLILTLPLLRNDLFSDLRYNILNGT